MRTANAIVAIVPVLIHAIAIALAAFVVVLVRSTPLSW